MANDEVRSALSMTECISNPDESFRVGVLEPLRHVYEQVLRSVLSHLANFVSHKKFEYIVFCSLVSYDGFQ